MHHPSGDQTSKEHKTNATMLLAMRMEVKRELLTLNGFHGSRLEHPVHSILTVRRMRNTELTISLFNLYRTRLAGKHKIQTARPPRVYVNKDSVCLPSFALFLCCTHLVYPLHQARYKSACFLKQSLPCIELVKIMVKMHSPPSSPGLFFSSPHHSVRDGPEDEVEALFASAQDFNTLDDKLAEVISGNKDSFLDVFGRQVQLLKTRSQAFEDAHVTVYDKVLLLLTQHGNDLESPAAINWYCAEYLGINPYGNSEHNAYLVEQAIEVPASLAQGLLPLPMRSLQQAKLPQGLTPSSSRKNSDATTAVDDVPDSAAKIPQSREDHRFTHLWSVYSRAYSDYHAVANKRDGSSLEAAKFLRDTAENGIHYLKDRNQNHPALTELSETYTMAKMVVLDLNGGKKRKFDRTTEKLETHPPHTKVHDRANAGRRHHKKSIRELKGRERKGREQKRGRGHSGIPYGYTRPVDSYYPA